MSIKQLNLAWDTECETHTQKLVLIALADNANDDGGCWPSLTNIARRCSLSRQGILDQIADFERLGWLKVERQPGKVNHYTLKLPNPSTALTSQPRGPVNLVDHYPSTALTGPVNPVDPNHKEPSEEPSKGKVKVVSEEGIKFATWFATLLPEADKVRLAKNWLNRWAEAYDDMLRLDNRTKEQVIAVCRWARADSFWSANFLSPVKLRHRDSNGILYFDRFLIKANEQTNRHQKPSGSRNQGTANEGATFRSGNRTKVKISPEGPGAEDQGVF